MIALGGAGELIRMSVLAGRAQVLSGYTGGSAVGKTIRRPEVCRKEARGTDQLV